MTIPKPSEHELPEIPFVDCGRAGPVALARAHRAALDEIIDAARAMYSGPVLKMLDVRSVEWIARNTSPYAAEIGEIARLVGRPGASALNISYEWACTSGVGRGRLLRTLDWPFTGLGASLAIARHESATGPWINVTWPGFVGVLTGMKIGKYAIALNQAPLRWRTRILPIDWLIDRINVHRTTHWPPSHVLRRVFETCGNFNDARDYLAQTPMALPALFALVGAEGEAAIIERQERSARLHEGQGAIANHWLSSAWRGRERGGQSPERLQAMLTAMDDAAPIGDFRWLKPPILNQRTRLAASFDLIEGEAAIVGLEASGRSAAPVTQARRLSGLR